MWQRLFNTLLNRLVKTALWFYFSEIEVVGNWKSLKDKPTLIISNHQNALLDALLIATYIDLKPYFLARASVFKNPLIAKILAFIRMVPVYRIRDGFGTITGNNKSFALCRSILKGNGKILIFPEGNHSLKRQVRPLSKGFTRIVTATLKDDPSFNLNILPIGINYQAHQKSGSKVLLEIGAPIPAKKYLGEERKLVNTSKEKLKSLTLHLPEKNYNDSIKHILQSGLDITKVRGQERLNSKVKLKSGYRWKNRLFKTFHFPLWLIWKWIKLKVKDRVFYGTIKFCIGLVGIPLYYLGLFILFSKFLSTTIAFLVILLLLLVLKINRNYYNINEEKLIKY
tara:strand:- start:434 stop:1453 length:1020 start_codon:yes stop_codon:yes gene_type:complete